MRDGEEVLGYLNDRPLAEGTEGLAQAMAPLRGYRRGALFVASARPDEWRLLGEAGFQLEGSLGYMFVETRFDWAFVFGSVVPRPGLWARIFGRRGGKPGSAPPAAASGGGGASVGVAPAFSGSRRHYAVVGRTAKELVEGIEERKKRLEEDAKKRRSLRKGEKPAPGAMLPSAESLSAPIERLKEAGAASGLLPHHTTSGASPKVAAAAPHRELAHEVERDDVGLYSMFFDDKAAERRALVKALAEAGFTLRLSYSSDGQAQFVEVTMAPRFMEAMMQEMRMPVLQRGEYGYVSYNPKFRDDYSGYLHRDPAAPWQMCLPAQRLQATQFALERRAFPFGFFVDHLFHGRTFHAIRGPSEEGAAAYEPRRPDRRIPEHDKDYISLAEALANGIITDMVALPEERTREQLKRTWAKVGLLASPPVDAIREYMGSQIAFFSAWSAYYNRQLILPSLFGAAVFAVQLRWGTIHVSVLPFYCLFMALWAVYFYESWKRRQNLLSWEWGVFKFDKVARERLEYRGDRHLDPDTGLVEVTYPEWKRKLKFLVSFPLLTTLMGAVVVFIVAMLQFQRVYSFSCGGVAGCQSYVASLATAVFVLVMNIIYKKVSVVLTDWENYRLASEHDNTLTVRTFVFQFANSFAALVHLGLWVQDLPGLRLQLFMNLCIKQIALNATEVLVPLWTLRKERRREEAEVETRGGSSGTALSEVDKELTRNPSSTALYDEMSELVLQLAYVTLFVSVFPIAPLAALLNNLIEVRVDAFKFAGLMRRPQCRDTAGIGAWGVIIQMVTFCAVLTNCAILAINRDALTTLFPGETFTSLGRVLIFFIAEHSVLALQVLLALAIPDVPESINAEKKKRKTLRAQRLKDAREAKPNSGYSEIMTAKERERMEALQREREAIKHKKMLDEIAAYKAVHKTKFSLAKPKLGAADPAPAAAAAPAPGAPPASRAIPPSPQDPLPGLVPAPDPSLVYRSPFRGGATRAPPQLKE